MQKTLFIIYLLSFFLSLTAQQKGISFQEKGLYDIDNQAESPNINGFTALDLFHEDVDNSVWVSPEKQCVTMTLSSETAQDGKYSLLLKWDKIEGGCKWIGMGFGQT